MASDVSMIIAETNHVAAIRESAGLTGRIMPFPPASLGSAIESVRAYRPKVVAIDATLAQTPAGMSFIDRVESLAISGSSILLLVEHEGRWVATPRGGSGNLSPSRSSGRPASAAAASASPKPTAPIPPNIVTPAPPAEIVSTRRAPRFLVRNPLDVTLESGSANLVDLSVLGAQVVSLPALRPGQKIKVGLRDRDDLLNVLAQVAWSMFEMPRQQKEPHYRVGLEFTDAAKQTLEQYRLRHCADQPVPLRLR